MVTFLEFNSFYQCLKYIFILLIYSDIQQSTILLFIRSLIPRQPFGGGRAATQSASRGRLVIQCWTDYKVANRLVYSDAELPSEFLRQHAHLSSNIREKKEETGTVIRVGQHIPAAYSETFLVGGQSYRRLVPFI